MSNCLTYSIIQQRLFGYGFTPPLDDYPGAVFCFSLRKLNTDYKGNCIKVRRDLDNTTQDIRFRRGILNTTELLSFVGSGSGYVHTWYDQSGNGRNATQTNASIQPKIVISGSITEHDGKPAIQFGSSNDWMVLSYTCTDDILNTFLVFSKTDAGHATYNNNSRVFNFLRSGIADTNSIKSWLSCYVVKGTTLGFRSWRNGVFATVSKGEYNERRLIFSSIDSSKIKIGVDGGGLIESNTTTGMDSTHCYLGTAVTVRDGYLNGFIDEVIVYNFDQSSNREDIESNINNFYSIY